MGRSTFPTTVNIMVDFTSKSQRSQAPLRKLVPRLDSYSNFKGRCCLLPLSVQILQQRQVANNHTVS